MKFFAKLACLLVLGLISLSTTTSHTKNKIDFVPEDICKLYVPNAFSPNGDGVNDQFVAASNCSLQEFEMRIFDRWGTLLFQTQNSNTGWNGKYNGSEVASTSYVYYIRYRAAAQDTIIQTFTETLTGDFALLR